MPADPPSELRRTLDSAYAAWDAGDLDTAAANLTGAVQLPGGDQQDYWFDLSLVHKLRRDWAASRDTALRAVDRGVVRAGDPAQTSDPAHGDPAHGDPAWWNLGIATTALRDWRLARLAWRRYGIGGDLGLDGDPGDAGDGTDRDRPIELDLGLTPVRLRVTAGAEVAWARRLCPARARVLSVPLPESGRHWGEVVLHDGVPNGTRTWEGESYPVFDELELFEPSDTPTFAVRVTAGDDDVAALVERVIHTGWGAEADANVRLLCSACAEGDIANNHDHPSLDTINTHGAAHGGTDGTRGTGRTVLVAAPEPVLGDALTAWRAVDPDNRGYDTVQRAL